ncbi:MAG: diguanylate cyclase [Gammaproteobacteria bacterium]|nr:diguanylate cyclase [Gammaproteobacteria bacterium]
MADANTSLPVYSGLALEVGAEAQVLQLAPFIEYAQTGMEPRTPEALVDAAPDWQQNSTASINLGYQKEPAWFRTVWRTDTMAGRDFMLEITSAQLDDLSVFLYEGGRLLRRWQTGDRLPFADRSFPDRNFVFPITLQPGQEYQLYFRVHNSEAMEFPVLLGERTAYSDFSNRRAMIDGVFYGILLIMAAYSFALYLILLDRTYLFYVSYVLSMLAFFLWQQGVLYQSVFPQWPSAQHYGAALISLLVFTSVAMFFGQFLELGRTLPRSWLVYKLLLVLHGIYCVLLAWLDYQTVMYLMVSNTVLSTIVAASAIIRLALRGSRSAQIVLSGWALFLFCLMFFTAAKMGVIYNEFMATYGLRLGISFEILIFSFALSFRINQARKEKEVALQQATLERIERMRAQDLALQTEMELRQAKEAALQLEIRHRESLQEQVSERTAELARTLANLEKANHELEKLSALDALTGIYNRRTFNEKLRENWLALQRNSQPLSVLMIDIDHFKHINDSRGHICGDYVLREFAAMLRNLLHRPSDIITRYGGEEFAILLPDTPLQGAEVVATSIVRHAEKHVYVWDGKAFNVTVSIGIDCRLVVPADNPESLVSCADEALYLAKQQGRNRWAAYGVRGESGEKESAVT